MVAGVGGRVLRPPTSTNETPPLEAAEDARLRALERVRADIVDAFLVEHNLPPRRVRRARGDVCDHCPGDVALRIAANDSLLECPRCGVARTLSSATAATATAGNEKDYSSHSSGRQKSRVVDVVEVSQGVCNRDARPHAAAAVMETLFLAATRPPSEHPLTPAAAAALEDLRAIVRSGASEDDGQPHALEAHANAIAAEVLKGGPFTSARDALARLGQRLPCLRAHLYALHYPTVLAAMRAAHEAARCDKRSAARALARDAAALAVVADAARPPLTLAELVTARAQSARELQEQAEQRADASAQAERDSGGAGSGTAEGGGASGRSSAGGGRRSLLGKRGRGALTAEAKAAAEDAKGLNASYDVAARVGALLSGFHGLRMLSQQREQIYALHGALEAELARGGGAVALASAGVGAGASAVVAASAAPRAPQRVNYEVRLLCQLLGLRDFLPLYPLPYPRGSPQLAALDAALKPAFERLGWPFPGADAGDDSTRPPTARHAAQLTAPGVTS